jgi:dienelactone hydrolase
MRWNNNAVVALLILTVFTISESFSQQVRSRTIEDGGTGAHTSVMMSDPTLPTHTLFLPADLSEFGKTHKLPVIVWGNGGCFNSPWEHVNFLSEVASHGFLVVAIGSMPADSGEKIRDPSKSSLLLEAIDWADAQSKDENSRYFGKLNLEKIAVSGMSCGGLQTLEVADDPRIKTIGVFNSGIFSDSSQGMPVLPKITKEQLKKIHTPTLYVLGGPSDIAYKNGMDDFRQINHVPIFVGNLDVGHGGTYAQPHGGEFARVATAWYQWQLKGDEQAGKLFTGEEPELGQSEGWVVEKKNLP